MMKIPPSTENKSQNSSIRLQYVKALITFFKLVRQQSETRSGIERYNLNIKITSNELNV